MARRASKELSKYHATETADMLAELYSGNEAVKRYDEANGLLIQHINDLDKFPFLKEGIFKELAHAQKEMEANGLLKVERAYIPVFSNMTDEQLKQILPFLNNRCFKNPLTLEQLKGVFQYKLNHVQVKSVPVLAFFFDALKEKGLLADGWQITIQEKEMFVSKSGKPLNQRYISRAKKNFKDNVEKHALWKGYFEDIIINGEIEQLKEEL